MPCYTPCMLRYVAVITQQANNIMLFLEQNSGMVIDDSVDILLDEIFFRIVNFERYRHFSEILI